ncbi:MAG: hypothetical protein Q7R96_03955 [Nanoarchaeota archaeon]|nr:hypothetical protein [Nanoarchaeota archaeon]
MQKSTQQANKVVVIGFIILLGIAAFFIFRDVKKIEETRFTYRSIDFTQLRDGNIIRYSFPIYINNAQEPITAEIRSNPNDLTKISYDPQVKSILDKRNIYVTMDKNATGLAVAAYTELKYYLANPALWNINTTGAFTEAVSTYPVKICSDVDTVTGIIYFAPGTTESITYTKGCAILTGPTEESYIRLADKLNLILLNIEP